MFNRSISSNDLNSLTNNKLWGKLKQDIINGEVFLCIRGGYVSFYYKGGSLFKFENEKLTTHYKYASVVKSSDDYISEYELNNEVELIKDFYEGYEGIKGNCENYSGEEKKGVASICERYPYIKEDEDIVVLDTEISFRAEDERKERNQIDLLLFNKTTKELKFYEAKHFNNKGLFSAEGSKPKVVSQINDYEKQIEREKDSIIEQYKNYVKILNDLFKTNLPEPQKMNYKVVLLGFGYDSKQKSKIKELLIDDGSLEGIKSYFIGNISEVNIETMWNEK